MRRTAGFSLIEVLTAVAILGIALVGLTHGLTTGLAASKDSELQSTAALIAAGRIELLRADGFLAAGTDEGELTGALALYRWKQTETEIHGLFEIEVRVEHTRTDKLIYELKTLLFEPPSEYLSEEERERQREDARRRERRQQ
jgi:prepilin-type N-terminal cleavage/methylation domain-containing protein